MDEFQRPVKLQRHVIGYDHSGNSFQFAIKLTYELPKIVQNIISELSAEKQILVRISSIFFSVTFTFSKYLSNKCFFSIADILPESK